jgi:Na+-translocating ferredoxin:NAD+ oxidoreductase RnfD subunit
MSTLAASPNTGPPRQAPKKGLVPPKFKPYLAPILITCILVVGEIFYGISDAQKSSLNWTTGLAILSAILMEMVLGRWVTGKWPHLASAYITGISVGIIIRSPELWPFIVCSFLSISSKYAIRYKGRHLFNPSNLGVTIMLLLVPTVVAPLSQQLGNERWVIIIIGILGSLILYTLGRLHISLTYIAAFFVLSFVRSSLTDQPWASEIAPLTSPAYMLFICFMITDPKTTTRTWRRQCAVAVLVAVVEHCLRLYSGDVPLLNYIMANTHAPYYALFIVAPVTNLIEICWDSRFGKKTAPAKVENAPAAVVSATPSDNNAVVGVTSCPPTAAGVATPPR